MQAVWEADTLDFRKRKRVVKACPACHQKKRKCCHTFTPQSDNRSLALQASGENEAFIRHEESLRVHPIDSVRFVGDLSPASFLDDRSERPNGSIRQSRVGVWIGANGDNAQSSNSNTKHCAPLPSSSSSTRAHSKAASDHPSLLQFLNETGAFVVLPIALQKVLVDLYMSQVQPLLPLIDPESFLLHLEQGDVSNFLVLAVCLTASRSSQAVSFLRWSVEGPLVPPTVFAKRLYKGLRFAMSTGQESDPLINIQVLGLLALYTDGPHGLENASMHLSQAIHHAHSLGIHIGSSRRFPQNGHTERMFWSLWCMDKWHACMAGRPVKIFDEDIAIPRPEEIHDQAQKPFHDHLAVCSLISSIIRCYRPSNDQDNSDWEGDFPSIDEVTSINSNLYISNFAGSIALVVELLYHIAAILACRSGKAGMNSYIRAEAAADCVELILRSNQSVQESPLPIASYAAALSMTVAYKGLRSSALAEISSTRIRLLAQRCEVLDSFKPKCWTVVAMARLGRKALHDIQRISVVYQGEQRTNVERVVGNGAGIVNPLQILSSTADSPAKGGSPNEQPQSFPTAAESQNTISTQQLIMEIRYLPCESAVTAGTEQHNDPFSDLDAAFEDFFDMSMPTTFFDPLFEDIGSIDLSEVSY